MVRLLSEISQHTINYLQILFRLNSTAHTIFILMYTTTFLERFEPQAAFFYAVVHSGRLQQNKAQLLFFFHR